MFTISDALGNMGSMMFKYGSDKEAEEAKATREFNLRQQESQWRENATTREMQFKRDLADEEINPKLRVDKEYVSNKALKNQFAANTAADQTQSLIVAKAKAADQETENKYEDADSEYTYPDVVQDPLSPGQTAKNDSIKADTEQYEADKAAAAEKTKPTATEALILSGRKKITSVDDDTLATKQEYLTKAKDLEYAFKDKELQQKLDTAIEKVKLQNDRAYQIAMAKIASGNVEESRLARIAAERARTDAIVLGIKVSANQKISKAISDAGSVDKMSTMQLQALDRLSKIAGDGSEIQDIPKMSQDEAEKYVDLYAAEFTKKGIIWDTVDKDKRTQIKEEIRTGARPSTPGTKGGYQPGSDPAGLSIPGRKR